ncbi:multicopper oxidase family protein [Ornithinimicrobium humiphilum]|uniref:FtsP/CotA-like multicopper oxidase with cupredoxin domain n=1 Tax=Ornithinimicrobium humiphilum TaxID=125288 RepID=A0A543K7S6_9MICO|nr:multicopper oxidase family protein [Ornithinimicrobium humiphilum]TQM91125.1 FtsP/CotA-like multicopper oxidase with cupredoxin domain [Ornithinimicrobium humiphilum]
MRVSRRSFLTLAGGVVSAGAVATIAGCSTLPGAPPRTGSTGALLRSAVPLPEPYSVPLPLVPVARPEGGGATYLLRAAAADLEILPGRTTRALTYGGSFPGPTIAVRVGEQTTVRLTNDLDRSTVLHLHGGVTPPEHDGWPTDLVEPGQTRDYVYPLEQRAAPLWYHDHTLDHTGPNVYAGLAGAFLLSDPAEDDLGLPRDERDVTLVVCDRAFGPDAELAYPALDPEGRLGGVEERYHGGVLGDCVLVNGAPWPVMEADAARYRFRVLNASNARRYELALDSGVSFVQVGTDLGLLARPRPRETVVLAPGERADVVVDLSGVAAGTRVTMTNRLGSGRARDVMQLHVVRRAADDSRVPEVLSEIEHLDPASVAVTRDLHFALGPVAAIGEERAAGSGSHAGSGGHSAGGHGGGPDHSVHPEMRARGVWTVAGVSWADDRDVATPVLGTVERWRLSSDVHHPVHAHLLHMQVDTGDGPAWKDTIDLVPGSTAEVLVPVRGYRGRYVLHCHNLEHEDMMMMVPFRVV